VVDTGEGGLAEAARTEGPKKRWALCLLSAWLASQTLAEARALRVDQWSDRVDVITATKH
jgi:hypothetical protein